MKKFYKYISNIILSSIHKSKFVWIDGKYNSVTLSHQLYRHLLAHTKKGDNQVFVFRTKIKDGWRYSFTGYMSIEPVLNEQVVTSELKLSPKNYFIGFANEHVPSILHEYNLSPDGVSKLYVIPKTQVCRDEEGRTIHRYTYYELQPHRYPFIP